ncbi:hydroxyethylthiazole kinase [Tepidibacillus marianensis]|uniref:hydroxyethylthiazole kinase n=1 Tax=Tepidibacillus marianensis TaxID=3131995 RepID=UPI0030CB202F
MELEQVIQAIKKVREKKPLIHHLTNLVVTNFTANGTIAYGASPIMANALEEVEEMVSVSNGLVINMGTITSDMVKAMLLAGKKANQVGVPIILDPVGVGATSYRTNTIFEMLEQFKPTVIRGNTAEMARLADVPWEIKGVDSVDDQEGDRLEIATRVAKKYRIIAAVTGKEDIVTDGKQVAFISNGHPILSEVTGTGCLVTALIGATIAAEENPLIATIAALTYYGFAAEKAAIVTEKPGTFAVQLIDEIYQLDLNEMSEMAKIEWVNR